MALKTFVDYVPDDKKHYLAKQKQLFEDYMTEKLKPSVYKEFLYPPFFPAETVKYINEEWEDIKEDDIFSFSFPKTGTAWTTEIIKKMLSVGDTEYEALLDSFPVTSRLLEMGTWESVALREFLPMRRRYCGSHLSAEQFPVEKALKKGAKIIVVLRNPKDQAVSWYHFSRKLPYPMSDEMKKIYPDDFDEFLQMYYQGKQATFSRLGEWYPHFLLSWYKYKDEKNVKFLYFEDMKKDFPREILGIADFLGVNITQEDAEQIATKCSFDAMKSSKTNTSDLNRFREASRLMRKGQVGNWKEYFTVAQSEDMDKRIDELLGKTDIKFTYSL